MAHTLANPSVLRSLRAPSQSARRSNVAVHGVGKADLIAKLSERLSISKVAAGEALDTLCDIITDEVTRGEKVAIMGFGSWEKRSRSARMGRNPKTGEPLEIQASFLPGFTAGKSFKERVNGKVAEPKPTKAAVPKAAAPELKAPKAEKPAAAAQPAKTAAAKPAPKAVAPKK